MRFIDEFRDKDIIDRLLRQIHNISVKEISIMEICGGHTMAIRKYGIPSLLPPNIHLISGPGCPVCVTSRAYIDNAITIANQPDVIFTTYGDLIRVPGSTSSMEEAKASGADIRIVYSTLDALEMARQNPDKKIVFAGIGFETTTPSSAVAILQAAKENVDNFFIYSAHKVMPPAMKALINEGIPINGYIGPGHVSTITGTDMYKPLVEKYGVSVVISGFEPVDILQSILMLVRQFEKNKPAVEIQYRRIVRPQGNPKARELTEQVFGPRGDWWRGLGDLPDSGMKIRGEYELFDAENHFNIKNRIAKDPSACLCGEVLKGLKSPEECTLYKKVCTPSNPVGACMVSSEGACQAYYRYANDE